MSETAEQGSQKDTQLPRVETAQSLEVQPSTTKEAQLDQRETRSRLDQMFSNAKKTVTDLARIGREVFEEQAARLGYKSERIKQLEQQADLDQEIRSLQEQEVLELNRMFSEWAAKHGDPSYLATKQREDAEWSEWLDGGLKWADAQELSPSQQEKVITGAIKRVVEDADSRVLFHATSKDRLLPSQEIQLTKDFSLQAVQPLERYFSSSRGERANDPYVIRIISRNRNVTHRRTGEFGEYGMDAGQELVRLPVGPQTRESATGTTYEVHTYIPKAELLGNELELISRAQPDQSLMAPINEREQAIKARYDRTKSG